MSKSRKQCVATDKLSKELCWKWIQLSVDVFDRFIVVIHRVHTVRLPSDLVPDPRYHQLLTTLWISANPTQHLAKIKQELYFEYFHSRDGTFFLLKNSNYYTDFFFTGTIHRADLCSAVRMTLHSTLNQFTRFSKHRRLLSNNWNKNFVEDALNYILMTLFVWLRLLIKLICPVY